MAPENPCDHIEEYLDDTPSPEEIASMERHIAECDECRTAVDEYRRLRRLALAVDPVDIPDDLDFRIRRRLAEPRTVPAPRRAKILYPAAFVGVAAAAVVLLAVLIRTDPENLPPRRAHLPSPVIVSVDPEVPLETSISDWLVQAGNAADADRSRLLAEAREHDLLTRIRAAIPAARGSGRDAYLTAVSDLLVQLENDPATGALAEEARLVAMVRPR